MLHLEPIPLVAFPTNLKYGPDVQLSGKDSFEETDDQLLHVSNFRKVEHHR